MTFRYNNNETVYNVNIRDFSYGTDRICNKQQT